MQFTYLKKKPRHIPGGWLHYYNVIPKSKAVVVDADVITLLASGVQCRYHTYTKFNVYDKLNPNKTFDIYVWPKL